ncbi:ComEC/Rec2 family competence protein [soil metagenome]
MQRTVPLWKKAPFLRVLIPFISGIILEWYMQLSFSAELFAFLSFTVAFAAFKFLPAEVIYRFRHFRGLVINLILIAFGALITSYQNIKTHSDWFGNYYTDSCQMILQIAEPVQTKSNTFQANAEIKYVINDSIIKPVTGKIIVYFQKDSAGTGLNYGDRILINKPLQPIKNSGNPGGFNYERYASFQGIFHTVYLKKSDWINLHNNYGNGFRKFVYAAREKLVSILRRYIIGEEQKGFAEALLIGYKADLDKDLLQAYTNSGVVHIIAISGLHLALIYVLLVSVFKRTPFIKKSKILQIIFVLACLWFFSILTGASASVLRSALMFTFIAAGQIAGKKASIYNSLSVSAFILLCINPYVLWDVGFQLSYTAIVSIVTFQKAIYNFVYIKNKHVDKIWQLISVTIAAQIFTFPVCIYYFHQFPLLFLLSNLIAIPLSTIILYGEIVLLLVSFSSVISSLTGKMVSAVIWVLNAAIKNISNKSYLLWDNVYASLLSTLLLYAIISACAYMLFFKSKSSLITTLLLIWLFVANLTLVKFQSGRQQKIIVYNVSKHRAIDFVSGNHYNFIGDEIFIADGMVQNFNLKPTRVAFQISPLPSKMQSYEQRFYLFHGKRVLLIDTAFDAETVPDKMGIDIIIISKNATVDIKTLNDIFKIGKIVFDNSNDFWKIRKWKNDCKMLHLPYYIVSENGAFVLNI